jgi:hypothetical protein
MQTQKETHKHGPHCGHQGIIHQDHIDYMHNGELHSPGDGLVVQHSIDISPKNPNVCTPDFKCLPSDTEHEHSANCGHMLVPHGDHLDYVVDGRLHHAHGDHCDDHGKLTLAK